jgi:2-(1,2-epoxy-1,2-dihydrophenyl)acetyl-CoA isomerase
MSVLELQIDHGVAVLTMNRPEARNALSAELKDALAQAVPRVLGDPAVQAIVLTGAGGVFCAGGDLRAMQALREQQPAPGLEAWRQRMLDVQPWLRAWLESEKPIVAAVDGAAYGAGFSLALTADFVLATPAARFCMSFLRVGLVPDFAALYTLPRVVGVQRSRELMLSAREVGAEEALRLGLVMEVHDAPALLPRALALARCFTGASPLAVGLIKRSLGLALAQDSATVLVQEASHQALCFQTEAHQQAVRRFLAKEPASFQWPTAPGSGAGAVAKG